MLFELVAKLLPVLWAGGVQDHPPLKAFSAKRHSRQKETARGGWEGRRGALTRRCACPKPAFISDDVNGMNSNRRYRGVEVRWGKEGGSCLVFVVGCVLWVSGVPYM